MGLPSATSTTGTLAALGIGVTLGCVTVGAQAGQSTAPRGQLVAEARMIDVGYHDTSDHGENLRVILPVRIHGHAASVMLDTGSPHILLDDSTMQVWNFPAHNIPAQADQTWVLDSLTIGTATEHDLPVQENAGRVIGTLPAMAPVIGLLGMPFLSRYDLVFDGPARRVYLYRPPPADTTWLPAGPDPTQCVPMLPYFGIEGFRLRFPLQVNGRSVPGSFDSGAEETVMNLVAAKATGATQHAPHVQRITGTVQYMGIASEKRYVWHGPPVQLATTSVSTDLIVLNTLADLVDMLHSPDELPLVQLGLGALHDRILVVSSSTHRVCLAPSKKP